LDNVRIVPSAVTGSLDAIAFEKMEPDGTTETWVRGRERGVSCFTAEKPRKGRGKWWVIPRNTRYDDQLLYLYNSKGDHWAWAPAHDMPLKVYQKALGAMNEHFR
jgi:hypothetical protein